MSAHYPYSFDKVVGEFWAQEEARTVCPGGRSFTGHLMHNCVKW